MSQILFQKAEFVKSAYYGKDLLKDRPTIALIGRSNVGKSTLINRLCRNKTLMRTGKTPGLTRAVNYVLVDDTFYLCDAPGYGFASFDSKHFEPLMKHFLFGNPSLKKVYILVDSRRCLLPADRQFADDLLHHRTPFSIVFTKTDKLKMSEHRQMIICKGEVGGELFESDVVSDEAIEILREDIRKTLEN